MPELSVRQPHADRLRPHPQQYRLVAKGKPWIDRRLEFDDQVYQRLHPLARRRFEILEDHLARRFAAEWISQREPRTGQIDAYQSLRLRRLADQRHKPVDPAIAQLLCEEHTVEAAARRHDQLARRRQEPQPRRTAEAATGSGQVKRPQCQLSLEEPHRHLAGCELEAGDLRGGPCRRGIDRDRPQPFGEIGAGTPRRREWQRQRDARDLFRLPTACRWQPVLREQELLSGIP